LIDSAYTGTKESTVFKKMKNEKNEKFIFSSVLNKELISGSYSFFKDSNDSTKKVSFYENGKIDGLEKFTHYQLCITGDCSYEVIDKINLISFYSDSNSFVYYGIKTEWDRIDFYNLSPPIKNIKGERKITNLAFTLYKSK
jgi:hypothetical protein